VAICRRHHGCIVVRPLSLASRKSLRSCVRTMARSARLGTHFNKELEMLIENRYVGMEADRSFAIELQSSGVLSSPTRSSTYWLVPLYSCTFAIVSSYLCAGWEHGDSCPKARARGVSLPQITVPEGVLRVLPGQHPSLLFFTAALYSSLLLFTPLLFTVSLYFSSLLFIPLYSSLLLFYSSLLPLFALLYSSLLPLFTPLYCLFTASLNSFLLPLFTPCYCLSLLLSFLFLSVRTVL
jgi:hypothetical protein